MSQVQETRAIAEMTYHKVNDIQEIFQSAVDFRMSRAPFDEPILRGCTMQLPSDYTKKEIKTLQSSSPLLSLTLGDLGDDSTGAFLERWLESSDPLPHVTCTLQKRIPAYNDPAYNRERKFHWHNSALSISFELSQFAKLCELSANARFVRHINTYIAGIPSVWRSVLIKVSPARIHLERH